MKLASFLPFFCPFVALFLLEQPAMARKQHNTPALLPGISLSAPSLADAAGIDEVGRGCLAGPVVACALLLPADCEIAGLTDSKKLTARRREELSPLLQAEALAFGLGVVEAARIDEINILQATFEAMAKALLAMGRQLCQGKSPDSRSEHPSAATFLAALPRRLAVDGNKTIPADVLTRILVPALTEDATEAEQVRLMLSLHPPFSQTAIVGGDARVPAISAASVVAKVYRDHLMDELERRYPGYGFATHKGYGTREHKEALRRLGPCPEHRRTFRGVLH